MLPKKKTLALAFSLPELMSVMAVPMLRDKIIETIMDVFNGFKIAINEPYSNSISPILSFNYQSVMIEVNKKLYMNEKTICLNSDSYKLHNLINKIYELILEN